MTNIKVTVVQKARYGLLFLPTLWLLFSLWVVVNEASERFSYPAVQETVSPPSIWEIVNVIYLSFMTVWVIVKILLAIKNRSVISSELKSGFALVLGLAIMTINNYFHLGQFLFYVGIALTDLAATIVIVTLLQRKSFGGTTLYHKDVQLRRV